jgi:hypothetical protein
MVVPVLLAAIELEQWKIQSIRAEEEIGNKRNTFILRTDNEATAVWGKK